MPVEVVRDPYQGVAPFRGDLLLILCTMSNEIADCLCEQEKDVAPLRAIEIP